MKLLTSAFADDAIPVDEFERRVAEVYRAENPVVLKAITEDLPRTAAGSAVRPFDPPGSIARRPVQRVQSVLSSVERRVPGPMPERLDVRAVMGSLEVDLRRAEFPPGVTEIAIDAILGSIEIDLPEHVQVEDDGHAFLGTFSVRGRSRPRGGDAAPVVRITGRSILASVEIELDD
ncbi:MAG: hypothetical protein HKN72_02300 [Gemmatimonadetes bacterium]|nr:hypothetical protein [Gemmatimonadota bacterium]